MGNQTEIAPGIAVEAGPQFTRPVLKGTNVEVATVLRQIADGRGYDEIAADLHVTRKAIKAALSYATDIVAGERTSLIDEAREAPTEVAPGITVDARVRFGKPVLKGTRVDVATLLGHLSAGETPDEVAEAYNVALAGVLAAVSYTHGIVDRETVSTL
jgi:uncharacterized protein (DUF433 family)